MKPLSIPLDIYIYDTRNSPVMFSSYTRTRTVQPAGLAPTFGVRCVHWTVSSVFTSASSGARTGQSMFSLRLARNVDLNRLIPSYETVRASVTTDAFFFFFFFFFFQHILVIVSFQCWWTLKFKN